MYIGTLPSNMRQLATKKAKRKDARQQFQDKDLIVINGGMVWIDRSVEEIMKPYSDSED